MHGFDHHNGIVDHDGDSQQQGRQRQQVDGEAKHVEEEERTDERYGHGNQRDERRAPVLQEHVDNDEHQYQREDKCKGHFLDGGIEELGDIVVNLIRHARREELGLLFQLGLHLLSYFVGVRTGNLLHHTHHRRNVVVLHRHGVLQAAQFNLGHVLQLQSLSVGIARDDDVAKLIGGLETACIAHGILVGYIRLLAECTRSCLNVLLGQHTADVRGHQVVLLHHVGLQPDAHGVGLHTWRLHVAHTLNTLDGRNDIDIVIVGEELVVVASVAGEGEHHHLRGLALHDRHTNLSHLSRQQGLSLRNAVLHVDSTHVGIHALTEKNGDLCRTRRGRRRDIVHAFHTVDALFKRRDDRVLHRLGIGTRIAGPYNHGRRCNIGILLNRQREQSDETQQHKGDGNHRGEYRAFYKVRKSHCLFFLFILLLHCSYDVAGGHGLGLLVNLLLVTFGRNGHNLHLVAQFGDAVGDILVADLQATGHDVVVSVGLLVNGNLGVEHLVAVVDGVDELLVLHLDDARLWDDDG